MVNGFYAVPRYLENSCRRGGAGGNSQRMLTVVRRGLDRRGIVRRTMYPVMPPRTDYALTPLGQTLVDAVGALIACADEHLDGAGALMPWADEHLAEVDAARRLRSATPAMRGPRSASLGCGAGHERPLVSQRQPALSGSPASPDRSESHSTPNETTVTI
jgi:DNA-binding HxlR family transcriptional regulator